MATKNSGKSHKSQKNCRVGQVFSYSNNRCISLKEIDKSINKTKEYGDKMEKELERIHEKISLLL